MIWKFLGTDFANIVRTYELATDELSRTKNVLEEEVIMATTSGKMVMSEEVRGGKVKEIEKYM